MNLHVNLSYLLVMGGLLNVLQADLEADRARLNRVQGTLSAMRSLSDTKANTEEYKAKVCFHNISSPVSHQSPSEYTLPVVARRCPPCPVYNSALHADADQALEGAAGARRRAGRC